MITGLSFNVMSEILKARVKVLFKNFLFLGLAYLKLLEFPFSDITIFLWRIHLKELLLYFVYYNLLLFSNVINRFSALRNDEDRRNFQRSPSRGDMGPSGRGLRPGPTVGHGRGKISRSSTEGERREAIANARYVDYCSGAWIMRCYCQIYFFYYRY